MIDTVTIAGAALDPCHVLATVTVLHGRKGFAEPATASSATITIKQSAGGMPPWQSGDTVTIGGPHGPMFSGRIVNRSLSHTREPDGTPIGLITITCAGPVAALGIRMVGDVPWPQEAGTARADKILAAAQVPYRVEGSAELQVLARDVDAQPALGLLDELAESTGATVFDTPDGHVVYQTMQERSRPVDAFMWDDFPTPPPPVGPVYGPDVSVHTDQTPVTPGQALAGNELGCQVTFAAAGRITGLRYHRTGSSTQTARTMSLWTNPGGSLIATGSTTGETGTGWFTVPITPVAVTAGQTFTVSFTATGNGPRTSGGMPITNGDLTAAWGVFGAPGTFPGSTVLNDYWADLVFQNGPL